MDVAEVLKRRRAQLGRSQQDVADQAGIALRQYQRYEAGERQVSLETAVKLAGTLDISISELAGGETHRPALSGDWVAAWQTWKHGVERVDTHAMRVHQEGDFLRLEGDRARSVEDGSYAWRGELRLWDNEALIGWYIADDEGVRSKGSIYLALHQHGTHAAGRWVGQSHDGAVVTGYGVIARTAEDCDRVMSELIEHGGGAAGGRDL